jgi:hypothetical protein
VKSPPQQHQSPQPSQDNGGRLRLVAAASVAALVVVLPLAAAANDGPRSSGAEHGAPQVPRAGDR